jgi:hypothetical protein
MSMHWQEPGVAKSAAAFLLKLNLAACLQLFQHSIWPRRSHFGDQGGTFEDTLNLANSGGFCRTTPL